MSGTSTILLNRVANIEYVTLNRPEVRNAFNEDVIAELTGWAEPKIVVRFWIVSFALALLALTTLKLR